MKYLPFVDIFLCMYSMFTAKITAFTYLGRLFLIHWIKNPTCGEATNGYGLLHRNPQATENPRLSPRFRTFGGGEDKLFECTVIIPISLVNPGIYGMC